MAGPSKLGLELEGRELALRTPAEMQGYLLAHPLSRGGRLWCERILEGVDKGERTALRLFSEAMKWTGATAQIGTTLLAVIGVSLDEAKRSVRVVQAVEEMDDAEKETEAIAWLKERGWTVTRSE